MGNSSSLSLSVLSKVASLVTTGEGITSERIVETNEEKRVVVEVNQSSNDDFVFLNEVEVLMVSSIGLFDTCSLSRSILYSFIILLL